MDDGRWHLKNNKKISDNFEGMDLMPIFAAVIIIKNEYGKV